LLSHGPEPCVPLPRLLLPTLVPEQVELARDFLV
jgi:hypothetical protein